MNSPSERGRVYVWTWLPGHTAPVVAGLLRRSADRLFFGYAESYRDRSDAMSLYRPELPVQPGFIEPRGAVSLAGCLRDGSPDAWGRRVIESRLRVEENTLLEEDFMLASGSNRFGANDFQASPEVYVDRDEDASLDELHGSAQAMDEGRELSPALAEAFMHGTSIGGARPKVLVTGPDGVQLIAKLSASSDTVFSVPNAEATALELGRQVGLKVPESQVVPSLGREVLLVRRFDRAADGGRRHVVSGLTMSGEDEMGARYVTYPQILDVLREHAKTPRTVGPELFERIVFNVAIGNSDDHARNHAAFWDGRHLELTPAYDLAPGPRSGEESTQAMALDRGRVIKESTFAACLRQAAVYDLTQVQAREVIDRTIETIHDHWDEAVEVGRLNAADRKHLWGRQILNPYALYEYPPRQIASG